jgi:multiple sugar transport system permease protein
VLQKTLFITWVLNTCYVTVLTLVGRIASACVVAYSLARFNYRGRDLLFFITLATMMLPAQVTLIPRYLLFNKLRWLNTFKPLWVPAWFGGGAFNIFLIRQFIMTIPKDLDEAAVIDGASYFRIFWAILAPLCKPVLATVAVIGFIATWNDYMDPLIFLDSRMKMTLAVGIDTMKQDPASLTEHSGEPTFHYLMALCVMAIIPCVLLFFFAQRYFVRGIVLSGIKG